MQKQNILLKTAIYATCSYWSSPAVATRWFSCSNWLMTRLFPPSFAPRSLPFHNARGHSVSGLSIHRWSSLEFLTNNKNDCFAFSALLRWAHPKKKPTCRVYFSNRRIFAALAGLGMSGRLDRCCRNSSSMFRTWRRKGNHVWNWYGIFSRFKFFRAFA